MSTVICPHCGTRNKTGRVSCRRCQSTLGAPAAGATMRGAPSTLFLDERWTLDQPEVLFGFSEGLFAGRDTHTGQRVLIHRLVGRAGMDRNERARFTARGRAVAAIDHPALLRVLDIAEHELSPSLVVERPDGVCLDAVMRTHGRLPASVALRVGLELLDALDAVHRNDCVYGPITPAHIMLRAQPESAPYDEDEVWSALSPFSLAVFPEEEPVQSLRSTLPGLPVAEESRPRTAPSPYVAPELLSGVSGPRSDLYAWAITMFELLTGEQPLASGLRDDATIIRYILNETPTSLRLLRPELSRELDELLMMLLEKDPTARPSSCVGVRAALQRVPELNARPMVLVPAGPFLRGSTDSDPDARPEEMPQRTIQLDSFFLDQTPVTSARFQAYLDATGYDIDDAWYAYNDPLDHPERPVVYVTWDEATAYAAWAGKRLPTEAEWEKAARGPIDEDTPRAHIFPWGDHAPDSHHAHFGDNTEPCDVGSTPQGVSPYGAHDMSGNVMEWVRDWYGRAYYKKSPDANPQGPRDGKKRVLRGGSFAHPAFALRCAVRGRYAPDARRANHSFRCAWSP